MKIKQIVAFLGISLFSQSAFAQFSGSNPATLPGDAALTGNLDIGSFAIPGTPARVNMFKTHIGLPSAEAPIVDYTTGMRFIHHFSPNGNAPTNYIWNVAADYNHLYFHFGNTDNHIMTLKDDGKVGVGVINPDATFHVDNFNGTRLDAHLEGFTLLDGNQASLLLGAETGASLGEWGIEYNTGARGLNFWKPWGGTTGYAGTNYHLFIRDDGKVSIGLDPLASSTYSGDYKLYVARGIMTEKVKVALVSTADWSDYVFADDYELMPLQEVEEFVTKHHHLPGVPSAEEVQENGIDVAKMDAKLLEKIEELTLHMIALDKKCNDLKKELEATKQ